MGSKGYGITQQDMVSAIALAMSHTRGHVYCLQIETETMLQEASRLVFVSVQSAKPRRSVL